jgi:tRNA threonylcarbamoyladenosine biosynthesis protein TsaB
MPRALALETSGRIGSVALALDDRILATRQFEHGLQNAAKLLPIIDDAMREQGWSPRDLQELYVSIGPGSFTGLRLAVTLAKTMALAMGVKIVAVPTLRVLVENAPPEAQHVIVVLDAKRDQVFTARFERRDDQSWIEREGAHLDALPAMLARAPRPVYLSGEGIPFHEKFIPNDDAFVIITHPNAWRARAEVVAHLGHGLARRGEFADPLKLAPIYIRLPEAEEKRLAQDHAAGG